MLWNELQLVNSKFNGAAISLDKCDSLSIHEVISFLSLHKHLTSELQEIEAAHSFSNIEEEVRYYKEAKPRFMKYGVYLHFLLEMYANEPIGYKERKILYYRDQMERLSSFQRSQQDMFVYFRIGDSSKDCTLFTKSSNKKDTFAIILAAFMLEKYLYSESDPRSLSEKLRDIPKLKWTGTKVELIELLYALSYAGKIEHESKELDQLVKEFEQIFSIDLDNHARTFLDIRNRVDPSKMLTKLSKTLNDLVVIFNDTEDNRKGRAEMLEKIKRELL